MALRDPELQLTYNIFGKKVVLPKGFFLDPGVTLSQNKTNIEEGFKDLQKWLKNPTPERWISIFGKNNTFGLQLRAYLLDEPIDLRKGTGLKETSKKVFDELNVKKLIKPADIEKINNLTIGGKGVNLRSVASSRPKIHTKFSMEEVIKTIKNDQYGNEWLRANKNASDSAIRAYANVIRQTATERLKLGGFPYGHNSETKLWSSLYRAANRGNRINIIGEFAEGKLPINAEGKLDWNLKNKAEVPAWRRVTFVDTQVPDGKGGFKKVEFNWDNSKTAVRGNLKNQIDTAFGKGKFVRSTRAYDTTKWLGAQKIDGRFLKDIFREKILRNELLTQPLYNEKGIRTAWKDKITPTEAEYKKYLKQKSPRFSLTEVHHQYGVGADPYTSESAFRFANRELGRVEQSFKAGTITKAKYLDEIKRINEEVGGIRTRVGSTFKGARATSATQVFEEALGYVGKENVSKLRNLYVEAAKTNKGGLCNIFRAEGGRIGYAVGSNCVRQMEVAFDADPIKTTEQVARLPGETGALTKIRNASTRFLSLLGKFGTKAAPLAALAGVGVLAEPLVKQFRSDDYSTYLSDPEQQGSMLLAMVEQETPKVDEEILKWQMPAHGAATLAGAVPGAGELYKTRRALRPQKLPGQPAFIGPMPKGVGPARAALGLSGVLGKALGASFSPLAVGATLPLTIAAQRKGGTDWEDIATDPSNWFGPAFAASGAEFASKGIKNPMLLRALRLGMSPGALRMISSKFGLPGLALTGGMWGYDKWRNWGKDKDDEFKVRRYIDDDE